MSYSTGEYVVYGGTEICLIDEVVKKCFDGVSEQSYFRLVPENARNSSYYIPLDRLEERVRPLLTREEIYDIIDAMPNVKEQWISDKNERRSVFSRTLKSDDYGSILSMMKALYIERRKRSSDGKQLMSSDEKTLAAAQKLMNREFAFVLGIREEDVSGFIEKRLNRE